jgi:hypothetical protein
MKPITPERRTEIEKHARLVRERPHNDQVHLLALDVQELLDAEEYWRKQIAGICPVVYNYENLSRCSFCGVRHIASPDVSHNPDCPWILAQER